MAAPEGGYPAVVGLGGELGARPLDNEQWAKEFDFDIPDNWDLVDRAGIKKRHFPGEGQFPSDMATVATLEALKLAGVEKTEHGWPVDLLKLSTNTHEQFSPSTAVVVNDKVGLNRECPSSDQVAACAGLVYGLFDAFNAMSADPDVYRRALVVGTEMTTAGIDPEDYTTAGLFGAGASALVLERRPEAEEPLTAFLTDPDIDAIGVRAGLRLPPMGPKDPNLRIYMDKFKVALHAAEKMGKLTFRLADMAGRYDPTTQEINWKAGKGRKKLYFAPHPGNGVLNEILAYIVGVPEDQFITSVADHGNTSSASIGLALHKAWQDGQIKEGEPIEVISPAIGAGMVAAGARYTVDLGPGDPQAEAAAATARQARRDLIASYPDTAMRCLQLFSERKKANPSYGAI